MIAVVTVVMMVDSDGTYTGDSGDDGGQRWLL
jgi:hypothetical protein